MEVLSILHPLCLPPMKISELATRTGVSAHRLRRYEALGLIHAVRRPSGYREFDDRVVREVIFISMGRDLGFSLKVLAEFLPRYRAGRLTAEEMIASMHERIAEVDREIESLRALRRKLVSHVGWFRKQQGRRERAARAAARERPAFPPPRKALR